MEANGLGACPRCERADEVVPLAGAGGGRRDGPTGTGGGGRMLGAALALPLGLLALLGAAAAGWGWLAALLGVWLVVGLLWLLWLRRGPAAEAGQRARDRWTRLAWCRRCEVVFDPASGQVVPLDQLRDYLAAPGR